MIDDEGDGIENTLGLKPLKEAIAENDAELAEELENQEYDHLLGNQLDNIDENELAHPTFLGVNSERHNTEVSDIHTKAIDAYEHIFKAGQNVDPSKSARMYEVAGQFLKQASDAANDGLKRELELAKLKIQTKKLEVDGGISGTLETGAVIMADRNELLKQMLGAGETSKIVDVEVDDDDETDKPS